MSEESRREERSIAREKGAVIRDAVSRKRGRKALRGYVILAVCIALALFEIGRFSQRNCREVEVVKTGLRATLKQAEQFVVTSHVRTPTEKADAEAFYQAALARLPPRRCTIQP
jgi:hypothetical protein